ncbi:Phosphatase dcr2 [Exophiala xenobiotica]|uniref:Phosphatase dcr2 n=1 Tax=Vermiconidia calcicola TaxID=1690605 RepID=A0AAV9QLB4_9PEZI|nr:Phosphatase dcr2 [Exophiala xenobiotica]KAK5545938.1 Phosphatase dcr2 [Vermiconidia calcicola]KAK5549803.1 Phosphatase dcr2 [Chaetothyriales sp. CCFEE 6169]KAK5308401.1 Phosphatase dcr2 [Exophiala xenobiotica]KAK5342704.1 Phosphatase dcr2 [Exophiala xenobiotica]
MTRRIVRTGIQLGVLVTLVLFTVIFLDNRYRVLPTSIHNHLPAHHPGFVVTDVTVVTCSSLNPFSSCTKDGEYWHRINKDLYLGKGYITKAYLLVERKRENDLKPHEEVIHDIRIGRIQPSAVDPLSKDERWESRPAGLWVKKSAKRTDESKIVTGVDVLFGADAADPRSNWAVQDISLFIDGGSDAPEPRLTIRKGPALKKVEKPTPRIRKDGKFKIMQAADLHLSTGLGKCRHALPEGTKCEADPRTLEFVERLLDDEKPDLVILSGDQVNGDTAPDAQSAIYKYSELFARHRIPYAGIFGNHDDEGNLDREASMAIMDGLPYSLSTSGPGDVDGVGNYVVEVLGRGSTSHSALTLYMLDTHSYSPDEHQYHGYDWLKQSQIDWFRATSQSLKRKHKEYTHIHMDLAFIHIPLPEYRNPDGLKWVGNWTEPPTAPAYNSNFKDALVDEGIVMVSCGHDHVNDYCLPGLDKDKKKPALWMCYGGGAGFGGYGGYYGYHRRIRFFDFDMNEARISTWKRLEWGNTESRIDEQIIVDGGKVVVDM